MLEVHDSMKEQGGEPDFWENAYKGDRQLLQVSFASSDLTNSDSSLNKADGPCRNSSTRPATINLSSTYQEEQRWLRPGL